MNLKAAVIGPFVARVGEFSLHHPAYPSGRIDTRYVRVVLDDGGEREPIGRLQWGQTDPADSRTIVRNYVAAWIARQDLFIVKSLERAPRDKPYMRELIERQRRVMRAWSRLGT